jgi:hypothetical protein
VPPISQGDTFEKGIFLLREPNQLGKYFSNLPYTQVPAKAATKVTKTAV